jgi:hypothetical protein
MKEAPESKTHEDVLDCGDGGHLVREITITEPAVPIGEEEPEAANMLLSTAISSAEKE